MYTNQAQKSKKCWESVLLLSMLVMCKHRFCNARADV